jgi:hypothetical protein
MQLAALEEFVSNRITVRRNILIAAFWAVSLLAFELFNFDTTQFALESLLGDVRFLRIGWATILAIAFCAIDFAGLVKFFTPEEDWRRSKETMFLVGAWLLGATMNAVMTWWAVSLSLLSHSFGNEILSREQLLTVVPIFVAVLVWLTRILFIGGLAVAGDPIFGQEMPATRNSRGIRNNGSSGSGGGSKAKMPQRPRTYRPVSSTSASQTASSNRTQRRPVPIRSKPRDQSGVQSTPEPTYEPMYDDLPPTEQPEGDGKTTTGKTRNPARNGSGRQPGAQNGGRNGRPIMPPIQGRSFSNRANR